MPDQFVQVDSAVANADLSAKQFYAIKILSTGKMDVATAAKNIWGVLQDKPKSGETGTYARPGSKTKAAIAASQTLAIGALVEVASGGTFTALASGFAVGRMREAVASVAKVTIAEVEILWSVTADT